MSEETTVFGKPNTVCNIGKGRELSSFFSLSERPEFVFFRAGDTSIKA